MRGCHNPNSLLRTLRTWLTAGVTEGDLAESVPDRVWLRRYDERPDEWRENVKLSSLPLLVSASRQYGVRGEGQEMHDTA